MDNENIITNAKNADAVTEDSSATYNGKRTDIHRPSAIIPSEYTFVAFEYLPGQSDADMGALGFLQQQREIIREHMARTGGSYSSHQHGGNCMVCGAWAIYTALFHHRPSNVYVRTGLDCADKMELGYSASGANIFRRVIKEAREALAGKQKAQALLADKGLSAAWELFTNAPEFPAVPKDANGDSVYATEWNHTQRDAHDREWRAWRKNHDEEFTAIDIVGKLVKYGSISDKTWNYLSVLVNRIATRDERNAAYAARKAQDAALAVDCPTGRIQVTGLVLSTRVDDSQFGMVTKMLVKSDAGYKVWGTAPSSLLTNEPLKGQRVSFKASVTPSPNDAKFGFFARPTNGVFCNASVAA